MSKSHQPTITAAQFVKKLNSYSSAAELKKYHRYFTVDEKKTGDGDQSMGVSLKKAG